mmetsp:Transcript_32950/g.102654  ORF Transcript_32950/g.102654 Transcript_32950/m.102654 type:complete len:559 (-) Transcript_32950:66-1742(-)
MAKLFDEIFMDIGDNPRGSGDIDLVVSEEPHDLGSDDAITLRCHSLILTQHPYFYKMLSGTTPLREGLTREVIISEPREEFIELIRFIYTSQIDINRANIAGLLMLADKYCIDEVVDLCLKYIKDNFDADMFFTFYNFTTLNSAYQEKLRENLMSALRQRRNLCSITEDMRWQELPIILVEVILSQDDLPIASEAEVLTLIAQWLGNRRHSKQDVARLLGAFRKCENIWVRMPDIESLMLSLGIDLFSKRPPRTGSAVWDPSFVIHRHEAAGPAPLGAPAVEQPRLECDHGEICHQLGPKDFLQQEPGWMYPGKHRCRVSVNCTSWSHRERRLLRSSPTQAAALQKRAFDCSPSKPTGHERSPSPPPAFQVRMPPIEAFETFDIAQMSDGTQGTGCSRTCRTAMEQRQGDVVLGAGVIRNLSQDKIDHELVDHQIICGVSSGYQRHGVRFSQRERNAIYLVEDLNGKQSLNIGGTTSVVTFDIELTIGDASKCGIRRCRFALLRDVHTLMEEFFDVSAKVPLRFYISSSYFDKNSSYTVSVRWLEPMEQPGRHYYICT